MLNIDKQELKTIVESLKKNGHDILAKRIQLQGKRIFESSKVAPTPRWKINQQTIASRNIGKNI